MISSNGALKAVKKKYPNRNPTAIFDYDDSLFIVAAPLDRADFNGSFFSVNKTSGAVNVFAPGEDYDKFFDAIDNRAIEVN